MFGFAFYFCGFQGLENELALRCPVGIRPNQNIPRPGKATQPGSYINGLTSDTMSSFFRIDICRNHQTRVNPAVHRESTTYLDFIARA